MEAIINLTFEDGKLPCKVVYHKDDIEREIYALEHIQSSQKVGETIIIGSIQPIGNLPCYSNEEHSQEIAELFEEFVNEILDRDEL